MKTSRILILTLGLSLVPGAPALRAQGHEAPAHGTAPQEAPSTAALHGEGAAPEGHGEAAAQGAHGEGHEGSHHARITLFGHELGTLAQFGVQVFNFALFAAILFFLLKGILSTAFKARTRELEEKLGQAERDKAEAAAQIQELDTRMAGLQQELEGIMAKAEAEALREKEHILESARQEAAQILAQTQTEIATQKRQAEEELRALVATLAVEGAARRIESRLAGAAGAQVLDEAISKVGGLQ